MDRQQKWKLLTQQRQNEEQRQQSLHFLPQHQSRNLKLANVVSQAMTMTQTNFSKTLPDPSHTPEAESSIWQEILSFLPPLHRSGQERSSKTHNYTRATRGQDYVFEPIDQGIRGYMTGYGKGIKVGDYLILQDGSDCCRYQVEEIDYYSNPAEMWIASLKKVTVLQS